MTVAEQRKFRLFRGTRERGELKEYQVAAGEGMVVRRETQPPIPAELATLIKEGK